ncbi:MAG: hypothetical protein QOG25_3319 [Acetobacteraceae bacterium]|jgi:hypothetical protein|nr:hypothetical protein [Acetobacteraceae bacterium]
MLSLRLLDEVGLVLLNKEIIAAAARCLQLEEPRGRFPPAAP